VIRDAIVSAGKVDDRKLRQAIQAGQASQTDEAAKQDDLKTVAGFWLLFAAVFLVIAMVVVFLSGL
jgi:hypothetical protein